MLNRFVVNSLLVIKNKAHLVIEGISGNQSRVIDALGLERPRTPSYLTRPAPDNPKLLVVLKGFVPSKDAESKCYPFLAPDRLYRH